MLILILQFLFFLCLAKAFTVEDCPKALTRNRYLTVFENKCFYFHFERKDYSDASATCYEEGGSLALVKTKAINKFLHSKLTYEYKDRLEKTRSWVFDGPDSKFWIGLNDLKREGTFTWEDGAPLVYDNFENGEGPHDTSIFSYPKRIIQDCVIILAQTGKWHDYKCEDSFVIVDAGKPFICEFAAEKRTTLPTTTHTTVRKTTASNDKDTSVTTQVSKSTTLIPTTSQPIVFSTSGQLTTTDPSTTNSSTVFKTTPPTIVSSPSEPSTSKASTAIKTTKASTSGLITTLNPKPLNTKPPTAGQTTGPPKLASTVPTTVTQPTTESVTGGQSNQTAITSTGSNKCPNLICNKDCGMDGFASDIKTGCLLCECDKE